MSARGPAGTLKESASRSAGRSRRPPRCARQPGLAELPRPAEETVQALPLARESKSARAWPGAARRRPAQLGTGPARHPRRRQSSRRRGRPGPGRSASTARALLSAPGSAYRSVAACSSTSARASRWRSARAAALVSRSDTPAGAARSSWPARRERARSPQLAFGSSPPAPRALKHRAKPAP